ncbi:MAG: hypothetical protein ACPG8W_10925 [Candidatus Promineifilaceae bacterium]
MAEKVSNKDKKQSLEREDIAKIAEKVYALWKHDLQILRERRRVHGRSFPRR